ncbi:major facilitator superfamily permease [Streptomyces lincolnensis]|nr:major facilitator superfamily permease [Streptomyces lincolnensis]
MTYDVRFSGTSGLAGTVRDGDGGWPVEGALIVVTDVRGEVPATVKSDHEGAFSVPELPAGDLTVAVDASGRRPTALPVQISGPGVTRVEVRLLSGAQVQGVAHRTAARGLRDELQPGRPGRHRGHRRHPARGARHPGRPGRPTAARRLTVR